MGNHDTVSTPVSPSRHAMAVRDVMSFALTVRKANPSTTVMNNCHCHGRTILAVESDSHVIRPCLSRAERLTQALMIHKDHVSAVMDVSFSPTGQEFATGSYDRTVRVFPHRSGRSREVYHTKRMQRVFCVNFSADARCVVLE